jgi:MYXO-CTERM domain-containing protein
MKKRIVSPSKRSSTSRIVKKLPTDFDIFSLSIVKRPLCIHTSTNLPPLAASLCAISFSWCGNCRSWPPPWMSKCSPRSALHIAEHSMCQPGRPGPNALWPLGVLGLALFRRLPHHEVERIVLAVEDRDALAGAKLVDRLARELAVAANLRTA